MPVNTETLNSQLYDTLRSKNYDPVPLDAKGDPTDEIETSDVIRFTMSDGEQDVQAWATIEGAYLVIYINDAITKSPDWESFHTFMKRWAQRKTLKFDIVNKNRLVGDMKKRMVMKKKEQVLEGYHPMGKKASYNDSVPQVKIILQHTRQIEEGEQRFRNIAKIFVENTEGERFLIPTNRPGLARVYARHIAEGGTPYDEKAKHITTLVEEYTKMAGFVRATRNGQFNESALVLVNEGLKHYNDLRMTLQGLSSHRGYNKYFESYTPMLNEETDDDVSLNELFVEETLDPRIESVMPILKRLSKNINEMSAVKELDEWAQSITEVEDETTKTLAVPADEMLDEAPGAETLKHNQDTEKSNLAAFDLAEGFTSSQEVADQIIDSIGGESDLTADDIYRAIEEFQSMMDSPHKLDTDDVAQIVMDRLNITHDIEEGVVDTLKKVGKKVADYIAPSDEQLLKDLQKRMGVPKHAQHGKPSMAKPNESVEEDLDADQKRVGQLGPTEPVGKNEKNLRGKLVGANESIELSEMDKSQPSSDRGGESSGNPYAKGGKATPVKFKDAAKDAEKVLNKAMDKAHKKDVKEGQDDLDAILRIARK